jgi:hypothetical protein
VESPLMRHYGVFCGFGASPIIDDAMGQSSYKN